MTEPAPVNATDAVDSAASDPSDPTDPPVESDPTPPAPTPAPGPIVWEPETWYAVTAACVTPGCPQENIVVSLPMFYSNNGDPAYCRVVCAADGCCGQDCTILTASKLDPQPVQE